MTGKRKELPSMKFQYSEKKVKLPGNVHAYAEKKVMKLARFFDEDAQALIAFSVEKGRNIAELTVHGAGTAPRRAPPICSRPLIPPSAPSKVRSARTRPAWPAA